jgi:hypothetical protein
MEMMINALQFGDTSEWSYLRMEVVAAIFEG